MNRFPGVSPNSDPMQSLTVRVEQLGDAQQAVYAAVARLPLVQVTTADMDYQHHAGVVNNKFVDDVTSRLTGNEYGCTNYYPRLPISGAGAIIAATANVVWTRELGQYVYPKYVVGAAPFPGPKQDRFTQLLLASPRSSEVLTTVRVNSTQWGIIKQTESERGLIPNQDELVHAYDPKDGRYSISASSPGALPAHPGQRRTLSSVMGSITDDQPNRWRVSSTTSARKAAKMRFAADQPTNVGDHLYPADFDRFRVLEHLVKLAGIFEKTSELTERLAQRAQSMPATPYEQASAGYTDVMTTIESGEAWATIDDRIDHLRFRSPE